MDIKINGNHLSVTSSIEEYIRTKFLHIPQPDKLNQVEFKIGVEKENQYVHFDANLLHEQIHLEAKDNDLYKAIDKLNDKIRKKFIQAKEKKHLHLHH